MSMLPGFGERTVPVRVKLAATVAFTMIVAPAIAVNIPEIPWYRLGFTEVVTGLTIGFLFRLFVFALQTAGAMAAQAASFSQLFASVASAEPQPVVSNLLVMSALALLAIAGVHVAIAELLIQSYRMVPPGSSLAASALTGDAILNISRTFSASLTIAAPFVCLSFLYNLTLGFINRAMPQLMVAFVGAPFLTLAGLTILALSAPLGLTYWLEHVLAFSPDASGWLR